jgi:hypothetical protein
MVIEVRKWGQENGVSSIFGPITTLFTILMNQK